MVLLKKITKRKKKNLNVHSLTKKIMKEGVKMTNKKVNFKSIKNEYLQNEAFVKEYNNLKPRYDIISQILEERKNQNITQEELANRIGTKKSNISRLESGNYNPTVDMLTKVAKALNRELKISLK